MHKGFTDEEIKAARKYAARINRSLAAHAFDPDAGFADHVTREQKIAYAQKNRQLAEEIEKGMHDNNFTIWQRMHYYLTGDCPALLP